MGAVCCSTAATRVAVPPPRSACSPAPPPWGSGAGSPAPPPRGPSSDVGIAPAAAKGRQEAAHTAVLLGRALPAEGGTAGELEKRKGSCTDVGHDGLSLRNGGAHLRGLVAGSSPQNLAEQECGMFHAVPDSDAGASAVVVKAMTYNLFWWNLYGRRNGNNGSASSLIAAAAPDMMGFQECDDVSRVLFDGGLQGGYSYVQGGHALAMAWRSADWDMLERGQQDVAMDQPGLYGARAVQWVRLQHGRTGKVVFFMNHHGPLRVDSGGQEGGFVTATNILNVFEEHRQPGDAVVLLGDFNAHATSETVRTIEATIPKVFTGTSFEGVDHVFSWLKLARAENLGSGGSDHDALMSTLVFQ